MSLRETNIAYKELRRDIRLWIAQSRIQITDDAVDVLIDFLWDAARMLVVESNKYPPPDNIVSGYRNLSLINALALDNEREEELFTEFNNFLKTGTLGQPHAILSTYTLQLIIKDRMPLPTPEFLDIYLGFLLEQTIDKAEAMAIDMILTADDIQKVTG